MAEIRTDTVVKKLLTVGLAAPVVAVALAVVAGPAAASTTGAPFRVGAAVQSFSPPAAGAIQSDPADCASAADAAFNGPRKFAFEEPYIDQQQAGHYDLGDPFLDCNHDGRW